MPGQSESVAALGVAQVFTFLFVMLGPFKILGPYMQLLIVYIPQSLRGMIEAYLPAFVLALSNLAVADPKAQYYGAELNERTLIASDNAQTGEIRFKDWLGLVLATR